MARIDSASLQHYFLEASKRLQAGQTIQETIVHMTELLVPQLADWCAVWSVSPKGDWLPVAAMHRDVQSREVAHDFASYLTDFVEEATIREALQSQQPIIIPEVKDGMLKEQFSGDDHYYALLTRLSPTSMIAAPLISRGTVLGIMALFSSEPQDRYTDSDLETVGQLALPYALALDNAQLHEAMTEASRRSIDALSTPVLRIRQGLLLLPLIGALDEHRLELFTDTLLYGIQHNRAKVAVLDVTGATLAGNQALRFVEAIGAARLLGASIIVTGISTEAVKPFASIGVDGLREVLTTGDLEDGIEMAMKMLNQAIRREQRRDEREAAERGLETAVDD